MKLREKSIATGDYIECEMNREMIDRRLATELITVCNYLIQEGHAQHRDEARILIANALESYSVRKEIARLAKHRIDHKHIGFGYEENPYYKNVNID